MRHIGVFSLLDADGSVFARIVELHIGVVMVDDVTGWTTTPAAADEPPPVPLVRIPTELPLLVLLLTLSI